MAASTLHPFVKAYISQAAPLWDLVNEYRHLHDPVISALGMVELARSGRLKHQITLLQKVSKMPLRGADPDLVVILFVFASMLSAGLQRVAEAKALHKRAFLLVRKDAPPTIKALVNFQEANILLVERKLRKSEEIYRQLCRTHPKDLVRHKLFVWSLCGIICEQGRGVEVLSEMSWLKQHTDAVLKPSMIAVNHIDDCLACGRCEEAGKWIAEFETDAEAMRRGHPIHRSWQNLLEIYRGNWSHGPLRQPRANDPEDEFLASFWSLQALLCRNTELALQWARCAIKNDPFWLNNTGVNQYLLPRAELSCGHAEAARRVIEKCQKRGMMHYFDDFFLARIEWQSGKHDLAAQHFARLLESVSYYHAAGRLDLELRLACEFSSADLFKLMRMTNQRRDDLRKKCPIAASPKIEVENHLIGKSSAMNAIRESVKRFASARVPVLITGETGTGKELVARALHDSSARAKCPFISVNCGAIAEQLLESELFGHARGAFTGAERARAGMFEEAGDGTLFLDEIGEITPRLQIALLRVLENGEIRPVGSSVTKKIKCRLLFATNVDLAAAVLKGAIRKDLLYRLRRLEIRIPPLRERPDDILPLAMHFLMNDRQPISTIKLSAELQAVLREYSWPGNVRELRNELERMRLLNSDKAAYDVADLDNRIRSEVHSTVLCDSRSEEFAKPPVQLHADKNEKDSELIAATIPIDLSVNIQHSRAPFRRLDRLRELFIRYKKLTRKEIAHALTVSPNTATSYVKILCQEGFIAKIEPSPSPLTHYFILNN